MIAAFTLFIVVALSALITRIAAIALEHTGLSTQSARFQARSAYTGAGYSTSESENIMGHPVRRKIIFNLMLIGNAGIVTVMSSLILTFVLPNSLSSKLYGLGIICVGMVFLWWAVKSAIVDRALSKMINKMLKRYTDLDIQDYASVLHLKDDYKISEKQIDADDWMCNQTLKELDLRKEGITILGVDRKDNPYFGSPDGDFKLLADDVITIYGKSEGIKNLYKRKKGFKAEMEHQRFVDEEEKRHESQSQSQEDKEVDA